MSSNYPLGASADQYENSDQSRTNPRAEDEAYDSEKQDELDDKEIHA